ncbi:MAG: lamin tail domain-containing protein [Candidatus Paceibacterota bacterium]
MFKKFILVFIVFVFFLSNFNLARAGVVINEVQLLPTGERFLELYNTGDSAIDLTNWYMQRKTATGDSFGSLVPKSKFEGKIIEARDYFVISRVSLSNSDIVFDSLTLTESNTIQIKKTEEEVIDKIGWGNASDCNNPCPPNPPEGQSIQKIGTGSWINTTPTPGTANENATPPASPPASNSGGSSFSASSSTAIEVKTKIAEEVKIKTQITSKTLGFVGFPLLLEASTYGYQNERLYYGKYFWNFGDGDSKEIKLSDNQPFLHTYFYPGEYVVMLDYYQNYYSNIPDASNQINIKIIGADVSISNVGDEKDFFIELTNNTDFNIDLSNWILASNEKKFTIPRNTTLASKKKIIISPRITNFSFTDKDTLKLMTPQQEIAFIYGAPVSRIVSRQDLGTRAVTVETSISENKNQDLDLTQTETEFLKNNLTASVLSSDILKNNNDTSNFSTIIIFIISFVFIGISAYAVYFIRQRKTILQAGSDFEILDE